MHIELDAVAGWVPCHTNIFSSLVAEHGYGCVPGTLYTLQKVLLFSFV